MLLGPVPPEDSITGDCPVFLVEEVSSSRPEFWHILHTLKLASHQKHTLPYLPGQR